MVKYVWYAAKLITSREGFCNVKKVAFPAEVKTEKCECGKHSLDAHDVGNFFALVAFTTSTIRNPASLPT
jgi:hypothetical protein